MTDRYRIEAADAPERRGMLRPVLWLVLVLSAATNATMSGIGANPFVGAVFGLVTLACATALVVHHYRHRAR
ncbi:hypothetical protein ACQEVZ_40595 [Dactylosporangium sp. CA-152071]|uniref:hypothetical protein n=1 Tax=Dactylosporangium sp. CA-152071 TaxID=3239933 RepID=UPI003D9405E1